MVTLLEMSGRYLEEAARLKEHIRRREEALEGLGPRQRKTAEHDLRLLRQMVRELREIGSITGHYYDRAYWRNRKYVF